MPSELQRNGIQGRESTKTTLTTLPHELHLLIFDHLALDPTTSTSLGLICHNFYEIHNDRHDKGDILQEYLAKRPLIRLLRNWMSTEDLDMCPVFFTKSGRIRIQFVTSERRGEILKNGGWIGGGMLYEDGFGRKLLKSLRYDIGY